MGPGRRGGGDGVYLTNFPGGGGREPKFMSREGRGKTVKFFSRKIKSGYAPFQFARPNLSRRSLPSLFSCAYSFAYASAKCLHLAGRSLAAFCTGIIASEPDFKPVTVTFAPAMKTRKVNLGAY